jgi:transposase-like protein
MSQRYSPSQKMEALTLLEEAGANIENLSRKLKIPVRTLYAWRKESRLQDQLQQISTKNTLAAEEKLQQLQQNPQLPPLENSAFGMTREQLAQALEVEYIPGHFNTIRQDLWTHIRLVQASISEDPDSAHVRALAVSRMLDDVLRLDEICRIEKPNLNVIKYEYRDGTYHNIPEWNNRVYERADQAYWAVLMQARREYYALKGEDYDDKSYRSSSDQPYDSAEYPTLAELAEMHFTVEDFIPTPRGFHSWMQERQSQTPEANPADYGFFDKD